MKIVRQLDENQWRSFVDAHPDGNIFHTPEMYRVFAGALGHKPELWATVDDAGQVLALITPVQVSVAGRLPKFLTTRAVAYGGVLSAPEEKGQEALTLLMEAYTREVDGGPIYTELRNLSNTESFQSCLSAAGFAFEEHLNYLVPLRLPADEVMQRVGSRTRKNIRRALREPALTVSEATDVKSCYDLLVGTYASANVPLADKSLFESAFEILRPQNMIRVVLTYVNGVPAASSVELLYKKTIYGWYGGLDRSYAEYNPNELMMWKILEWGAENGYTVYDFGGAGKPNEKYGVRDFKAKFGGDLVNYGRNIYVHAPLLLRLSTMGYQLLRRFL